MPRLRLHRRCAAASAETSLNVISGAGVAACSFARRARRIRTSSHIISSARSISRLPSISQYSGESGSGTD